jgi:nickel-dependent lactate racemase
VATEPPRAEVVLPYGPGRLAAPVPEGWALDLIAPAGPGDLPDLRRTLFDALDRPLGSAPLRRRLPEQGRVLLLLSDHTRRDGKRSLVPLLLEYLEGCGVRGDRVHLMFAAGTHPPMTAAQRESAVGAGPLRAHPHFQHDCEAPARSLGTTGRGTPVALNERLWDYELVICVSGVTHHYFAGFTGGRKLLLPGAAARRSILANHRLVLDDGDGGGRRTGVGPGRLAGNAVAEDMAEAAALFDRPVFAVAGVAGQQPDGFAGLWAGALEPAHRTACRAYLGWRLHRTERRYDLVLSASGGHPLDRNLIQAHKGLDNAARLLAPGGVIVHAAACDQGLGAAGLEPWLELPDRAEHARRLRRDYTIYAQTLLALRDKAAAARIILVTHLEDRTVRALGMEPAGELGPAIRRALAAVPAEPATALFPDASRMLPVPADAAGALLESVAAR